MTKYIAKSTIPAVTKAAGLASRALIRLEDAAKAALKDADAKDTRSLQLVQSNAGFSALIKSGRTTIQIENGDFAVSIADAE
jgi:hypothetical protein